MNPILEQQLDVNRRHFFKQSGFGIGTAALASLLNQDSARAASSDASVFEPTHSAKAKQVIYLFQSGGPAQMDLYDEKPALAKLFGTEVPTDVYPPERKTTMSSGQAAFPLAPTGFKYRSCGQSGMRISKVLPKIGTIADDICLIRSMHTDAINHDPAITFFQTGSQMVGRPSIGSWLSYGLGSDNADLPAFVAMSSGSGGQPLYDRLWGSGFMPGRHQGVKFRSNGDPVLDLTDPPGVDRATRRKMLDLTVQMNELRHKAQGGSDVQTRIAQYELAYRLQMSIPGLTDLSNEPAHTFDLYGQDAKKTGTYAYNCLIARRLIERGVRFVQLFHRGWDHHGNLPNRLEAQAKNTDQATAALVTDLKQRGLLDETLVVWGGEFGRTIYCQGKLTNKTYGRDHHPSCFSMWMAGGGVKGGTTYGKTDDFSVNVAEDGVSVHDLHATMLHLLGIDHKKLTYRFQGRFYRLTDVYGEVIDGLLA